MTANDERRRLLALASYEILNTPSETSYDDITRMAAQIAGCPVSFISFIDAERQWFKSRHGFDLPEIPREFALCNYLIEHPNEDGLVVPDARTDERFNTSPFITSANPVVFCASLPLKSPEGLVVGTLCVADYLPRQIGPEQVQSLRILAACVSDKLELKKQKRRQEEIAARQALLRKAVHASSDLLFVVEADALRFVAFNQTVVDELGYSEQELLQMGPHQLTPFFGEAEWQAAFRGLFSLAEGHRVVETAHQKKDGGHVDLQVRLSTFCEAGGKDLVIASARNVTQERAAVKRLAESEQRHRDLFTWLPNMVMRTTTAGVVEMISPACFDLLGYRPEELLGTTIANVYANLQDRMRFLDQLNTHRMVRDFGLCFVCKDGTEKQVSVNAQYCFNEAGEAVGIEGVVTDITELLRTKEEIRSTKDFYEDVLNALATDVAVFDEDDRYRFLNRQAVKDDALRAWLIGRTDFEYFAQRNKPTHLADLRREVFSRAEETGQRQEWLEEVTTPDGEPRFVLRLVQPLVTKDGRRYKVGAGTDVTPLKAAQRKLAQSESYLTSLLNSLPDVMLRINAEGRVLDYKAQHPNQLVLAPEQFLGKTLHEVFEKAFADTHLAFIQKALASEQTITYEYELPMPTGAVHTFEARVTRIFAGEAVAIMRDITERKQSEHRIQLYTSQLKEREASLSGLIRSAPDGIVVIDREGNVLLWNPMCEKVFGWTEGEAVGKRMSALLVPERLRAAHDNGMKRFLQTKEARVLNQTLELTALNKRGEEFFIELTVSASQQNGQPVFIAFLRDVSERKRAQDALKKRERQLTEAHRVARLASYELNPKTNQVEWTGSIASILDVDGEVDLHSLERLFRYIHPADLAHFHETRARMTQEGTFLPLNVRIVTPAGEIRHVSVRRMSVQSEGGEERILGTVQDVTEQKQVERKILEAVIETEERERTRIAQELHDGVCPDIAAVQLMLNAAQKMTTRDAVAAADLLGEARAGLLQALDHTRRVSHELLPKNIREEGLAKSLDDLLQNLNRADTTNYRLVVKGAVKEPDPLVSVNLYRIAQEFIRNSQKHSGAENVSVLLHFQPEKLDVVLTDDGCGFDAENVKKNGIGFVNMAKRIETIGGRLNLSSQPNQGVLLHLSLPL